MGDSVAEVAASNCRACPERNERVMKWGITAAMVSFQARGHSVQAIAKFILYANVQLRARNIRPATQALCHPTLAQIASAGHRKRRETGKV